MINLNRWGGNNNYSQMNGFQQVDYSGGWGQNHDQMLMQNVQMVFQQYDGNRTGQLEGQEFFYAYRDLCLRMGMAPPNSQQEVWQAVMQCDTNRDGRVNPQEMYYLFKRVQGINAGQMQMQMNMGGMGGMGGMGMGSMGGQGW